MFETRQKRYALLSESSYRFERRVDIGNVDWASQRAASLMVELAGARVAPGIVDVYPVPHRDRVINCRYDKISSVLGVDAPKDEVLSVFQSLGLEATDEIDESFCAVRIPSFRSDLEREVDLVEEFARIQGLDKIPTPQPRARLTPDADDSPYLARQRFREQLVGLGFYEISNYSLVPEQLLNIFDKDNVEQRVELSHPLSQDQAILRSSLIPQMVDTLARNFSHQIHEGAFFELGRTYVMNGSDSPEEHACLSMGIMGPLGRRGLNRDEPVDDDECFLWMKGVWEGLLAAQGITSSSSEQTSEPYYKDGYALRLHVRGKAIGSLGLIRDEIRSTWRITSPVATLEVQLEPLLENFGALSELTPVAPYPSVERDVALIVDTGVRHEDILSVIEKAAPKELENVELFDIFEGKKIGKNKKSMAYSMTYRSPAGTLTDEDANRYHDTIKSALKKTLDVEIRED